MLNKIKLTNILNELQVTPQGITPEKVKQYFEYNLDLNNNEFDPHSKGWKEYWEIKKQYIIKYNLKIDITSTFELIDILSKPDLFKFYNEMRALVRKHVGKEILSELQIKKPPIKIPKGWSEIQLDAEDIKEGIIYWFSAPMEGWDKNHEDFVKIIKKDNEFIIEIIYAFGDLIEEDEKFTSLKLALNKANEIMKEISEDWENEDDY